MDKKKEPENCWEYWKCLEEIIKGCPAYKANFGRECWLLASHFCPRIKRDFERCWECSWFKQLNSDIE